MGAAAGQALRPVFLLSTHTQAVSIRMNRQAACLPSMVSALTKVWVVVQYVVPVPLPMSRHPLSTGWGPGTLVSKSTV